MRLLLRMTGVIVSGCGVVLTVLALMMLARGPQRQSVKTSQERHEIEVTRKLALEENPNANVIPLEQSPLESHREKVIAKLYVSGALLFGGVTLYLSNCSRGSRRHVIPPHNPPVIEISGVVHNRRFIRTHSRNSRAVSL